MCYTYGGDLLFCVYMVRLSVRFLEFLKLNFASMASSPCRTALMPSAWPSERRRVSRDDTVASMASSLRETSLDAVDVSSRRCRVASTPSTRIYASRDCMCATQVGVLHRRSRGEALHGCFYETAHAHEFFGIPAPEGGFDLRLPVRHESESVWKSNRVV
jgi:hypothetical protein